MFPTLSRNPSKITKTPLSNTITQSFDGGYTQARERNTRVLNKFVVEYSLLSNADTNLIMSHYATVKGSTPFDWVNAVDNNTYNVRYTKPIDLPTEGGIVGFHTISLELVEV